MLKEKCVGGEDGNGGGGRRGGGCLGRGGSGERGGRGGPIRLLAADERRGGG